MGESVVAAIISLESFRKGVLFDAIDTTYGRYEVNALEIAWREA
jgi:hypothetical protein